MNRNLVLLLLFALLSALGCSIEESDQGLTGSVYVTLSDTSGSPIERATIWVDGAATSYFTPGTVSGLSVGSHVISASRPDVYTVGDTVEYNTADTVQVQFQDTTNVFLTTAFKPVGPVKLESAPDSTVLILNFFPSGITPPSVLYAPIGSHSASAYLAGNATNLPAKWTLTVVQNDTASLPVSFTPVATGSVVDNLAPVFDLLSDFRTGSDTTNFRLQDYRGQVVLLTFFFADCAPCVAEMPFIQEVYADPAYAGKIQFFGIDPQDPYFVFAQFRSIQHPELGLTFPLLYGTQQGVREAYNVVPFPSNIFIDQTGKIRYREAGVDEDLLRNRIQSLLDEVE